ncbi:MAG TPA: HlyD family efflux transporter periplasmic adaptor subunit [Acidimicrobiales bacterium]
MSTATETSPPPRPDAVAWPSRRGRRRARWVIAVVAVLVAAGVVLAVTKPFDAGRTSHPGVADNADPTSLQTVVRQDLTSQTEVSATLGYAGSYSVVNQAQGTVTSLPSVGQVVSQGQVLYEVSGAPVVLLYGSTPAYRSLSEGTSTALTGPDVAELNTDLVALGYVTSSEIPAGTDEFTYWTKVGVEKLQAALGVTQNGTLSLGQVVFEPTAVRVTSVSATLGASASAGQPVLSATSTTRQVSIALDADEQSEVAVGDKVSITLPNNDVTPGVISSVGTVATAGSSGSSPTITVLVNPTEPAATGDWDQAPVNVTITTGNVTNALVVPVDALLAQSGGGYAVEVVDADGIRHLVSVTLGLFDDADGLVQVSGSGLAAGQKIVVPNL